MEEQQEQASSEISTVKAKFAVTGVNRLQGSEIVTAIPVTSGSEENKSFSKFTPSGKLEMYITNENLFGWFQPGEELYLDITKAPKP